MDRNPSYWSKRTIFNGEVLSCNYLMLKTLYHFFVFSVLAFGAIRGKSLLRLTVLLDIRC